MTARRALLVGGLLASILYVAIDVLCALRYGAYHSFTSQMVSELMADGAPTERFVDPLFLLDGLLVLGFGVGVIWSAGARRSMRVTGGLIVAIGILDLPGPVLFEMNLRGSGFAEEDVLHIAVTATLVVLILAAMAVSAFAVGGRFRGFAFAMIAIMLVAGPITALQARDVGVAPTPWLGLTERIDIGAYLVWQAVLAAALLYPQGLREIAGTRRAIATPTSSG